jgi:hypothetical protein
MHDFRRTTEAMVGIVRGLWIVILEYLLSVGIGGEWN